MTGPKGANSVYFLFCLGDRSKGFSSAAEYFDYILSQDWEQLSRQTNSTRGENSAELEYASFHALKSLVPGWVNKKYNHGPFKLVLDDVGLSSVLVRSKDDLTIVGMFDLEWIQVAPAQMAATAPWWLLQERLNNWDLIRDGNNALALLPRYLRNLQLYQKVLVEEEEKLMGGDNNREFSDLVEWSRTSGAMWFHMLLAGGFNIQDLLPYYQLIQHVGPGRWEKLKQPFYKTPGMMAFVKRKVAEKDWYDEIDRKAEAQKADFEGGRIRCEDYIAALDGLVSQLYLAHEPRVEPDKIVD